LPLLYPGPFPIYTTPVIDLNSDQSIYINSIMKNFLPLALLLSFSLVLHANTITWDGGGDGLSWSDANNWVGNIIPGSTDDVLLDNSLMVSSYTVNLPTTAVTIISLHIFPAGANTIKLLLPSTNTLTAAAFVTTGVGYTVTIESGGTFENAATVPSGTNFTIADSFRINNGGQYIHRTRSGYATWVARLSKITGTENGTFEFDVPFSSFTMSLSGRTYGNLVLSAVANGGTVTYSGAGASPLTTNGDFRINTGVTFTISMSGNFVINGNFIQGPGSTFNLQNSTNNNTVIVKGSVTSAGTLTESNTGLPTFQLGGSTNQSVTMLGSLSNSVNFEINNPAGATLSWMLTIPYKLTLTSGKITTSSTNLLTMDDNATYSGGSSASFIDGPMGKIGNDNFTFPVGKGSIYAPVGMINVSGETTTDEFTAEYIRSNPQSVHGSAVQAGQDHASSCEYWSLTEGSGSAVKMISLAINYTSFCFDLSKTYVSRWNGAGPYWTNEGSTNVAGPVSAPYVSGTITSTATISTFGDFTAITDLAQTFNPLPVKLNAFEIVRSNNNAVLKWELATCCSKDAKFELERSTNSIHFTTLKTLPGNESDRFYSVMDAEIDLPVIYYRLKITDYDGTVSYSKIITLENDTKTLVSSIFPNPVKNNASIVVKTVQAAAVIFTVLDMTGRVMKQWNENLAVGASTIYVNTNSLPAGMYQVVVTIPGNQTNILRFIKE
jgi:hypothetical protein